MFKTIFIGVLIIAMIGIVIYYIHTDNVSTKEIIRNKVKQIIINIISDSGMTWKDFITKDSIKQSVIWGELESRCPMIIETLGEDTVISLIIEISNEMTDYIDNTMEGSSK